MENTIHISDADKATLKQKSLSYLPRNLGEMDAHIQILNTIAKVIPEVSPCAKKAEAAIWPQVKSQEITVNRAIAQCAYETNTIIGNAALDMSNLQNLSEQTLLEIWIALDYYSYVLKADYSVHIRKLQDQIGDILLHPQPIVPKVTPTPVVPDEAFPPTTPIEPITPIKPIEPITPIKPITPIEPITPITPIQPVTPVDPARNKTKTSKKSRKSGKGVVVVAVLALIIALGAFLLKTVVFGEVRKVEQAISRIGTVTLDSEEEILNAEELYDALDSDQQEEVDNIDELFTARAEYDALVTDDAIEAIGTVTMDSKAAIEKAEALYDALSREARNLVKNYKTLTAARTEYTRLETAIQDASDAIDAIGPVTLNSGAAIEKARSAYDALKKDNLQDYLADKVSILTAAEAEYNRLVIQDLYDTGMSYYSNGKYQDAITCFDQIIEDCSDAVMLQNAKDAKADAQIELARASYKKKDYYNAMQTLNEVDDQYRNQDNYQTLHDQIISALKKNRPGNSSVIGGKVAWGYCYFKVTAGNQDVCFKFENIADASKYKMVYVRAGQTVKVNMEDGTYCIKWATGEYWYDADHMFGSDTVYKQRQNNMEFITTTEGNTIYFWYTEIDLMENPNMGNTIDESKF